MLLTHNMLVAKNEMKKIVVWRPWRFRPSYMKSAKWMCTKRSAGGRYHCIRSASIWPPRDTFAAAGGCSKELKYSDSQHTEPKTQKIQCQPFLGKIKSLQCWKLMNVKSCHIYFLNHANEKRMILLLLWLNWICICDSRMVSKCRRFEWSSSKREFSWLMIGAAGPLRSTSLSLHYISRDRES